MIIIPAAGEGRRFKEAGYKAPKHQISLLGRPLIDWVVENVRPLDPHGEVIVATQLLVGKTSGALDTVRRVLNGYPPRPEEPLVIANCDQLIALTETPRGNFGNGLIYTFPSANPAHSYVETGKGLRVKSIVEKPSTPPSNQAVSGVYLFANPASITKAVNACHSMSTGLHEEYLSDAIAWMLREQYVLYAESAPTAILGTPEDFQRYETAVTIHQQLQREATAWPVYEY